MSDDDLSALMDRLIRAQAYRCGSPSSEIRVNTEDRARDDGCDGWSAEPARPDDWLGESDTCWQFKAGTAGQPMRLAGEVGKPIPKKTLASGGRFVVVASGSTSGKKGEEDRLEVVVAEAEAQGLPTARIDVIGSERLAGWCNGHPASASYWAGRPAGLWTFDQWAMSDEHQVEWQASDATHSELNQRRSDLDLASGGLQHLHIEGAPGVGKTRFALELCRGAPWCNAVVYVRQAEDLRLQELIDSAAIEPDVQLVVVADEVQPEQLRPLRDAVGRSEGRVKLISVGHAPTPDPTRIPALRLEPLEPGVMRGIVQGWHPAMPLEHVEFVIRFADGYVRLARLAAVAVATDHAIDVRKLLTRDEIRGFLDGMLGPGDRRALHVAAVLTSVGWVEDKQNEGEAIAKHLGLDWNDVRARVEDFHRQFGIVPRGGRYRYVSPTPLGIHIAVEAWAAYPDLLRSLPDVLPTEQSRDAYYARLQSIASNPGAREYAREELTFFFRLDDFVDAWSVRRWSALSSADPDAAATNVVKALRDTSVEDRRKIDGDARRQLVWTLVALAWRRSSFHEAVRALALLAEAESESWANNATAEFLGRFQIVLGGTAVPYLERLSIIDELLASDVPPLASLAVKALAVAGSTHASRVGTGPAGDELPEREWRPSTRSQHRHCIEAAVARLTEFSARAMEGAESDLVSAAKELSMMLRESSLRGTVLGLFEAIRKSYPEAREPLRRAIADVVRREKKYWKKLPDAELEELESLRSRFEDASLGAQLRQLAAESSWEAENEGLDLTPLAKELVATPDVLAENWTWLTSGEAQSGWRLGAAIAAADPEGRLAETLTGFSGSGRDLRLLCAYVGRLRETLGDDWYDDWMRSQSEREPSPNGLLFEAAWRCGATESVAQIIADLLRSEDVQPGIVGQLAFGRWGQDVSEEVLRMVIEAMVDTGHEVAAIAILDSRMSLTPEEAAQWKPLALRLVTTSRAIRSRDAADYAWKELAEKLVEDYPAEIAASILREQVDTQSESWFAEYSQAGPVLRACVEQNPAAVWKEMQPLLASKPEAYMLGLGLPAGILDSLPVDEVGRWVAGQPEERAAVLAPLVSEDLASDNTLWSRIVGEHGGIEAVASAFFSEYVSGSWVGPASCRWDDLAERLEEVADRTALPRLRDWAGNSARSLREMAERDRKREAEEKIRGR